jgi:hypothetical protein
MVSVGILMYKIIKIKNPVAIPKPKAATMEQWDEWKTKAKKEHPIKYFLSETIPREFRFLKRRITDFWWEIKYRTISEHKYNLVDTGLKPGYYEIETRMLYSCFSLLCSYVEKQMPSRSSKYSKIKILTQKDYVNNLEDYVMFNEREGFTEHAKHYRDIKELYLWWKQYLQNLENDPFFDIDNEEESYKEQNEKLTKLISLRGFLWV